MSRYSLFLLAVSSALTLRADLVTNVTSTADSYLQQLSPDANNGSSTTLIAGTIGFTGNMEIRRGILRFDLSNVIPTGATINSVTLQVTVTKAPFGGANSTFDLVRVLEPWDEMQVTWNSRLTGTGWNTAGVLGGSDCSASASSSVFISGLGTYVFPSSSALVSDVQAWANSPASNFGWLLVSENEGTAKTARHFGPHEDPANAPVLTIHYTAPATPPPPAPPSLSRPALSGQLLSFSFNAQANHSYFVEVRPDVGTGNWAPFTNIAPQSAPSTITITDTASNASRLYRVRAQ